MQIIIPTRGRTNQQLTLQSLPGELRQRTTIVCPKNEAVRLSCLHEDVEIVVQPDPDWKIARKREWICGEWMRAGYDKIIMLDDDLSFATRISADDWHLRKIRDDELISEFHRIEDKLGPEFPHVGFGQRLGNHLLAGGWKSPARMLCTLGYYLPIVTKECRFDLVELHEDLCVTLQLLLKGYPNAVWTETIINWCNLPGGASTWRTVEMSNAEARKLAELFPDYVSVVQRDYKASVPRLEVMVRWQRALEDGQRHRRLA
ncbi:MAG: hypothetical protein ACLQU2_32785 [Candidatus Binataceae bacterium]